MTTIHNQRNDFEGKVAFVTGAATGIGFAAARQFASRGASVVLAGHNRESIEAAAASLVADGDTALPVECDVTDEQAVAAAIATTVETYGRLDTAYNNAGVQSVAVETPTTSVPSTTRWSTPTSRACGTP